MTRTRRMYPSPLLGACGNGEGPVRVWREMRGMKATDLATAADISLSYLSAIESGAKRGSVDALKRLAKALGVGSDDLA